MHDLRTSLVFTALTLALCAVVYPAFLWLVGHALVPASAEGSLVEQRGAVVGSALVAQEFTRPGYLWPRPSAVGYAADAAGGSNLSPANPAVAERTRALLARPGMVLGGPVPAELVLASGSGLDPHVTLAAALYQVPRIAAARGLEPGPVAALFTELARDPGDGLAGVRLVNVLAANLALDEGREGRGAGR